MAKDLVVGSTEIQHVAQSIANFMSSRKLEGRLEGWLERPDTIAEISCFNGATVLEFLKHVVLLEGYSDENAGYNAGAEGELSYKNFPWWDNSLWLPVDFDNPGGLEDDPTFFIGSCQQLIAELDELQRNSPLMLGEVVSEYSDMRADFLSFIRSDKEFDFSSDDYVRWIWKALRDGAELAIEKDAPLWMGPD